MLHCATFACSDDRQHCQKRPFTSELSTVYINIFIPEFINSHIKDFCLDFNSKFPKRNRKNIKFLLTLDQSSGFVNGIRVSIFIIGQMKNIKVKEGE